MNVPKFLLRPLAWARGSLTGRVGRRTALLALALVLALALAGIAGAENYKY